MYFPRELAGVRNASVERTECFRFPAGGIPGDNQSALGWSTGAEISGSWLLPATESSDFGTNKCASSNGAFKKALMGELTEDLFH
jgi:hypothetical protein